MFKFSQNINGFTIVMLLSKNVIKSGKYLKFSRRPCVLRKTVISSKCAFYFEKNLNCLLSIVNLYHLLQSGTLVFQIKVIDGG